MNEGGCVFCGVASGDLDADTVYTDGRVVAFRDIVPKAPVHVLIIPREHVASVDDLADGDAATIGHLFLVARDIARSEGLADDGYRLVVNTGRAAGQTVPHLHLHLLGGRELGWPPG
jgi:histidine triad (HIT) family protein